MVTIIIKYIWSLGRLLLCDKTGVKGARFTLPHERIAKPDKMYETIVFRHQAQDHEWRQNTSGECCDWLSFLPGESFQTSALRGETQPWSDSVPKPRRWSWESRCHGRQSWLSGVTEEGAAHQLGTSALALLESSAEP